MNVYEQILEFCVFKCELYFDFESQCIWSNGSDYELIYKTKLKKKNLRRLEIFYNSRGKINCIIKYECIKPKTCKYVSTKFVLIII